MRSTPLQQIHVELKEVKKIEVNNNNDDGHRVIGRVRLTYWLY